MAMFDKIKNTAGNIGKGASGLKDAGVAVLKSTVDELNATLPYLKEVGYTVNEIEVEVGLSPKVILHLYRLFEVNAELFATVLASQAQRKVFCTILNALQQANILQGQIHFQGRYFAEMEIELGMPPAVRMKFLEVRAEGPRQESERLAEAPLPPTPAPAPSPGRPDEVVASLEGPHDPELPSPPWLLPAPPADVALSPGSSDAAALPTPATPAPGVGGEDPVLDAERSDPGAVSASSAPPREDFQPPTPSVAAAGSESEALIRFQCPGCGRSIKTKAGNAGWTARCTKCGKRLTVPAASS
jgi:hypothetical protein